MRCRVKQRLTHLHTGAKCGRVRAAVSSWRASRATSSRPCASAASLASHARCTAGSTTRSLSRARQNPACLASSRSGSSARNLRTSRAAFLDVSALAGASASSASSSCTTARASARRRLPSSSRSPSPTLALRCLLAASATPLSAARQPAARCCSASRSASSACTDGEATRVAPLPDTDASICRVASSTCRACASADAHACSRPRAASSSSSSADAQYSRRVDASRRARMRRKPPTTSGPGVMLASNARKCRGAHQLPTVSVHIRLEK